ncbi:hypothetical protein [Streptomyces varsoviensis]|uniref:Uncharacterized protein n=1 Tax=Streptomyces varsoviensis TaxID=67373 RepID=A0ABR5IQM7_9ACTN|nr:hypothetical protein [Streptomyces varsoviensis]KOG31549.1 hypothetical protein ADK38_48025 [Streptomyces varsoviensis]
MAKTPPQQPVTVPLTLDQELCELALIGAPRSFAVVQEWDTDTEDPDGEVVAWGLAHEDGRVHVVSTGGRTQYRLNSPEQAVCWFGREPGVTARIVWFAPPANPAFERGEAA